MTSRDKRETPEVFAARVEAICDVYDRAAELHDAGVHVISVDEKTGMQAVERKYPTKPPRPGLVERREFEYVRHGTLCLTANLEVATGRILSPTIAKTRTTPEFVEHIAAMVETDPEGHWIFVVDNLDTHRSEELVRYVAELLAPTVDLGKKFVRGVLRSRASRAAFLADPGHRIRFLYTPRHCSWLNQVELWFSILARRVLRRGSFDSKSDLRDRVLSFIDYFNDVLAKPFRWTYQGKLLAT